MYRLFILLLFIAPGCVMAYDCPNNVVGTGFYLSRYQVGSPSFLGGVWGITADQSFNESTTNNFYVRGDMQAGTSKIKSIAVYEPNGSGGCQIMTSYNGAKTLNVYHEKLDPTTGVFDVLIAPDIFSDLVPVGQGAANATPLTFTFVNGIAEFIYNYDDVGFLRLVITDPETNYIGESSFVSIPFQFVITEISGLPAIGPLDTTGTIFKRAGEVFTIKVEAQNQNGNRTPNFGKENSEPPLYEVQMNLVAPADGSQDAVLLNKDQFVPDTAVGDGAFINTQLAYEGVGFIQASVHMRAGFRGYLNDIDVSTAYTTVGRFVPYAFLVSALNSETVEFQTACSSNTPGFTYLGQPITFVTKPQYNIVPISANGNPIPNYIGDFWRLPDDLGGAMSIDATTLPTGVDVSNATTTSTRLTDITDPNTVGANYEFNVNPAFSISRPDTVGVFVSPFDAELKFSFSVVDADNIQGTQSEYTLGAITTGNGLTFSNGKQFIQGRIRLDNVNRSELLSAEMPVTLEYYDGNAFVPNTSDSCTQLTVTPEKAEYAPSELNKRVLTNTGNVDGTFTNGQRIISIARGVDETPTPGYIDVILNVMDTVPWLGYPWNRNINNVGNTAENPMGQVTFGIYAGETPVLYRGEVIH